MSPISVLVTGSNRGIGLEFIRQLVALKPAPRHVLATCRQPDDAKELNEIAKANSNVSVVQLDVTDYDSYPTVAARIQEIVGEDGLDLLVNNAGIYVKDDFESVSPDKLIKNFTVNSVTPIALTKALLPLLQASARSGRKTTVANVTSKMGSLADNSSGGHYSYRTSKAALNMISRSLSVDLAKQGILVAILHPGWVQTDMGGPNALITTQTCVAAMLSTIEGLDEESSGQFLNYDGKPIPW